jgi:hypothetical protein
LDQRVRLHGSVDGHADPRKSGPIRAS